MTSRTKSHALAMARAGWRIVPVWGILSDEHDPSDRWCSCPRGRDCPPKSSGKHPHTGLAPHAARDATDNIERIGEWPDHLNIGLATSARFVSLDIDDVSVAKAMLDTALIPGHTIALTGSGGLHLYVAVTEDTPCTTMVDTKGHKVGDLRADGQYCVLPPSWHMYGNYRWLGSSILDEKYGRYTGTGYAFATEILSLVGVELRPYRGNAAAGLTEVAGAIEPCDLPFDVPIEADRLRQLLSGTAPRGDRSKDLYTLACDAYRAGRSVGVTLEPRILAGVVKKIDAISGRKFTGRHDEDQQLWNLVTNAILDALVDIDQSVQELTALRAEMSLLQFPTPAAQPEAAPAPVGTMVVDEPSLKTYDYDPQAGFIHRSGKKGKPAVERIATFEPVITEVLEVWNAEEQADTEDWQIRLSSNGTVRDIRLEADDRGSLVQFRRAIATKLPPEFVVETGAWDNLLTGMQYYSFGKYNRRRVYGATGWLPDRDAFLLPGAPGAITATGVDLDTRCEMAKAPARLLHYGELMAPGPNAEDALAALLQSAPPAILMPVLTQALAAPLTSLGMREGRTIIHLFAKTGSLKTSLARTILSLFGRFWSDGGEGSGDNPVSSWTGTSAAIEGLMHLARDLPLLVDDYKLSIFRSAGARDGVVKTIQNYADGTARARSTRSGAEQAYKEPRCLLISTGEDVWDDQESVMARTIVVDVPPHAIDRRALATAQSYAASGAIATLGYEWLMWLCQRTKARTSADFDERRKLFREHASKSRLATEHPRIVNAVAALLAADSLVSEFVAERFPSLADMHREVSRTGWRQIVSATTDRTIASRELSPFASLVGAVQEAIVTRQAMLEGRLSHSRSYGATMGEPIGYIDDDHVYFSKKTTWAWFERSAARRGQQVLSSWESVVTEAKQEAGGNNDPQYLKSVKAPVRMLRIARDLVVTSDMPDDFATIVATASVTA